MLLYQKTKIDQGYRGNFARFSDDKCYRSLLVREWSDNPRGPNLVMCGLNPSIAGGIDDDPTIRVMRNYAKKDGFNRLVVMNLWDRISTDPTMLFKEEFGPPDLCVHDTVRHVVEEYCSNDDGSVIVAAWGTKGAIEDRDEEVMGWFEEEGVNNFHCLAVNGDFTACHPLRRRLGHLIRYTGRKHMKFNQRAK